ncbi:chemotaxis protein [Rhodoferax sp. TS-BS-61-7]|nr:chemotaxis protein [Rhodoferax sp. TS-BS-61-7]
MKGMLEFLEKAGLVKNDIPAPPPEPPVAEPLSTTLGQEALHAGPALSPLPGNAPDLESIYANSGIAPSIYPAERLLRLLDGLSAMDEATRLMAIKAMDEADESWSIQDPLSDAAAKLVVLATHTEQLQNNLQILQDQTQSRMNAITARADQAVGDIRKQIAELEALATREQTRAVKESTAEQSNLKAAQDQTARELSDINALRQRLQGLATQFQNPPPSSTKD